MPSLKSSAAPAVPPHYEPEAILAHPRFPAARRAYVEAILGVYEHDTVTTRLLTEVARSVLFFSAICLHCAYDEHDRATWPTMSLLKQTVAEFGLSSPRRVDAIMAQLVQAGYFTSKPAAMDRRARILAPAEKALDHDREWLAAQYAPLGVMFPDPGYPLPLARDPHFQKAQRTVGLSLHDRSVRTLASNPAAMLLFARDAGAMVLIKLVQLAREGDGQTATPLSFADFATRFGTSRTHVRDMLQDAERAGLLLMTSGAVTLTPTLLAAFDRFVADVMANHDLAYHMTMRVLGAARAT